MKHLLTLLLLLIVGTVSVQACSCTFDSPTLCQYANARLVEGEARIITGVPVRFYERDTFGLTQTFVDVAITGFLVGTDSLATDTITFSGQDGLNCGLVLSEIDPTAEQLFYYAFNSSLAGDDPFLRYPLASLGACGPSVLPIQNGMIVGPVAPGVDSVAVAELATRTDLCFAEPTDGSCFCTADERPFCVEAENLDRGGADVGVVRLTILPDYQELPDFYGNVAGVRLAVITEELVWSNLRVGDTVTVVSAMQSGCLGEAIGAGDDALWLYTIADTTGGLNSPLFQTVVTDYTLLSAPGCAQVSVRIEDSIVRALPGDAPYETYLGELAECLPALSAEAFGQQIGLRVYPNPATDQLTVTWETVTTRSIELIDARGQVVTRQSVRAGTGNAAINTSALPAGVYFVRMSTDEGAVTRKVVVQ